jgi:hypothetical protein
MPGHIAKSRAIVRRYRYAGFVAGALLLMLATRQQMSHSNARCKAPIRVRWIKMVIR